MAELDDSSMFTAAVGVAAGIRWKVRGGAVVGVDGCRCTSRSR
jgi:hypothetical protein